MGVCLLWQPSIVFCYLCLNCLSDLIWKINPFSLLLSLLLFLHDKRQFGAQPLIFRFMHVMPPIDCFREAGRPTPQSGCRCDIRHPERTTTTRLPAYVEETSNRICSRYLHPTAPRVFSAYVITAIA